MSNGWIGCDLDGTLAEYNGWKGPTHIGPPVAKMVTRIKMHLALGEEVRIMTARVSAPPDPKGRPEVDKARSVEAALARVAIAGWVMEHIGQPLAITCEKDYGMRVLYDDRCIQIIPNTGEILTELAFRDGYIKGMTGQVVKV